MVSPASSRRHFIDVATKWERSVQTQRSCVELFKAELLGLWDSGEFLAAVAIVLSTVTQMVLTTCEMDCPGCWKCDELEIVRVLSLMSQTVL